MADITQFACDPPHSTKFTLTARRTVGTIHLAGIRLIALWIERARQRQALADLDDRLLGDIGITRKAATGECAKPFWR